MQRLLRKENVTQCFTELVLLITFASFLAGGIILLALYVFVCLSVGLFVCISINVISSWPIFMTFGRMIHDSKIQVPFIFLIKSIQ